MSPLKRKPASMIGAPISADECQQLKAAFTERFPGQVPAVFLSREIILNSIEGIPDVSGILFTYGLDDAGTAASRRLMLVPARNRSNGESGIIKIISSDGYLCENGERISFRKLMTLLGNHVTNFKDVKGEIPLSKLPRGYFWGINKIKRLLEVENGAGLVFHFGYNPTLRAACRQFQCVLEVVDGNQKSLNVFMEYGQCSPPCPDEEVPTEPTSSDCVATIAAEKYLKNKADGKLDVLRAFRDNWLLEQENGQVLYEMYYFLSQSLVAEMLDREDQESIWQDVYENGFLPCLDLIKQNKFAEAKTFYVSLMQGLVKRFLVQEAEVEILK